MEREPLVELTELDSRKGDGLLVTLWWVKGTLDTYVEIVDLKTQPPTVTEVPVLAPATPNEVYNTHSDTLPTSQQPNYRGSSMTAQATAKA
jgi:hypothetical protein